MQNDSKGKSKQRKDSEGWHYGQDAFNCGCNIGAICSSSQLYNFSLSFSSMRSSRTLPTRAQGTRYYKWIQSFHFENEAYTQTFPLSSFASGVVPAYNCVMAPSAGGWRLMNMAWRYGKFVIRDEEKLHYFTVNIRWSMGQLRPSSLYIVPEEARDEHMLKANHRMLTGMTRRWDDPFITIPFRPFIRNQNIGLTKAHQTVELMFWHASRVSTHTFTLIIQRICT